MCSKKTELLTTDQIAEMFHVSPRTVFRWLASGKLKGIRIGNITRVRREDLEDFLQDHLTTKTKGNSQRTESQ
ncbi:MAG: helix-turn-helix domain-containing protein [Chloroflexi bacterium]|nr:helix-turn-helix domain-containing protein [Chloroflexota bacterium]